ncbi:nickel pincer cofactor biosynthesis protein LarC [Alienimonas chondri]|uniref:Putative nickel insertion protein n=1 Tax=Alienimonas chondri TaxID=2681879 RepID=A0ABX1V8Q6_9PLAN|nr:nickel pincer cofactor biosynthesis protein LarC [Alienimonas chondri]NNJ24520.1 Pyridinium-3,5-bisthiocarboxylic acid mononucleotide nickel insertion protein [Alienimonas chondri]
MKLAHLDTPTGIAGDMTLAALLDAGVDEAAVRSAIDSLGLEGVELRCEDVVKFGFRAKTVHVVHPPQHAHRHLSDIREILDRGALTPTARDLADRLFYAVAVAEARVHGSTPDAIHFHEVGAIDSIVDIVGCAVGFDLLGADRVTCSPVPTGRGRVKIAHGICPVPAPATAELLKGVPLDAVSVDAELTTPTGAAIVSVIADGFGDLPAMTVSEVGLGAGDLDLPDRANLLRLFVGTAEDVPRGFGQDRVFLLETNLDDETPETVAHASAKLFDAGAVDVFALPATMKKGRSGVVLSVLCPVAKREACEGVLFAETATFGVRRRLLDRTTRPRREATVETAFGPVLGKVGAKPGGGELFSPEFDACAKIAADRRVPLRDVYRAAEAAFLSAPPASAAPPAGAGNDHSHGLDHDHSHGHDHDHSHGHDHDGGHDHSHG